MMIMTAEAVTVEMVVVVAAAVAIMMVKIMNYTWIQIEYQKLDKVRF